MYHRIVILALLFLIPEESNSSIFLRSPMEISDALPVQFWLTGCETYNEHETPGVHHVCFCQPWQCDDEIKLQFKDTAGSDFSLLIYDDQEQLLDSIDIDEISTGVYQVSFIPSETSPEVCDRLIQLQIQQNAGQQGFDLPPLDEWLTGGATGTAWTLGSNPSVSGTDASEYLYVDYAFVEGTTYTISINFTNSVSVIGRQFDIYILDGSFNVIFNDPTPNVYGDAGPQTTDPLTFTATSDSTRIAVRLGSGLGSLTVTVTGTNSTMSSGSDVVVAKSDCLDIKDHPESILLAYSNHRNFAGIQYELSSPEEIFYIRVPSVFYHERYPEEDEVIELSSSLATLNGTVKKQRRLDTDYMPYYMHEKMKLILKHQSLEIYNRAWIKQEAYEILEGDKRWPVKMARVWLSERDFVHRNIL